MRTLNEEWFLRLLPYAFLIALIIPCTVPIWGPLVAQEIPPITVASASAQLGIVRADGDPDQYHLWIRGNWADRNGKGGKILWRRAGHNAAIGYFDRQDNVELVVQVLDHCQDSNLWRFKMNTLTDSRWRFSISDTPGELSIDWTAFSAMGSFEIQPHGPIDWRGLPCQ